MDRVDRINVSSEGNDIEFSHLSEVKNIIDKWIKKYGEDARLEIEINHEYIDWTIHHTRPETEEEMNRRLFLEELAKKRNGTLEREQLRKLLAKYPEEARGK